VSERTDKALKLLKLARADMDTPEAEAAVEGAIRLLSTDPEEETDPAKLGWPREFTVGFSLLEPETWTARDGERVGGVACGSCCLLSPLVVVGLLLWWWLA
jgi:hypothetical protein